jgi:hypothetical protein
MGEVLGALLVFLLLPVAFMTGATALVLHTLRRANRIVPSGPAAGAPLRWLWSPSTAATLHRRLRAACLLAGAVPGALAAVQGRQPRRFGRARPVRWARYAKGGRQGPLDGISQLAQEVVQEAVELDHQLSVAAWLARGLPREQAFAHLDYQVSVIEDAARRVHQLAARQSRLARPGLPSSLSLQERIGAMEEAVSELTGRPPNL